MRNKLFDWIIFILSILWGTVLFAGVAVVQKAFFVPEISALLDTLRALTVAGWIFLAALGIGWSFVRVIDLPATREERWLVAALLGLGGIGLTWLVIGLIQVPPIWLSVLILAFPLLLLWRYREPLPGLPSLRRSLWLLLVAILGISLIGALTPPISFDALLYHLRLPELWLSQGTLFQTQKSAPYFFPVLTQSLYTPAYQLGGGVAAALLHWIYLLLILSLLWRLTRRFLPTVDASLVLVLALSIQMVPMVAAWTYTDMLLVAYQIATLWALLQWRAQPASQWHLVAAIFTGLAVGIKYLAVLTPLLALLFIVVVKRRDAVRYAVPFAVIAGLVGCPSYLRNLIATGNPFFPFALPSPYWDTFRATWYKAAGTGIGWSFKELLAVPYNTTLGIKDASYFDGRTGPLIATFLPLSLWFFARGRGGRDERPILIAILAFAGAYCTLWLFGIISSAALWQARFLITPLLLFTPVVAWGFRQLESLTTSAFSAASLSYLFVNAWLVLAVLIAGVELFHTAPFEVLLGHVPPAEWRAQRPTIGSYQKLVDATQAIPEEARLLLLVEPRSYGMPPDTQADTLLYQYPWRLTQAGGEAPQLTAQLCAEQFTHVGVYWHGAEFLNERATINQLSDEQFALLQSWSEEHDTVWKASDGGHELLRLNCKRSRAQEDATR